MSEQTDIIYTQVDEAPELASRSFLSVIQSFTQVAGIKVGTMDISLAGRIIAQFPNRLKKEQQQPDDLALLGEMVMKPEANIIKLPNISASLPQIKAAVAELQSKGYNLPDYPEDPQNDEEKTTKAKYDKVKGSARSTRFCDRVTRIAGRLFRSKITPRAIRTKWVNGPKTPKRMSQPCRVGIFAPMKNPRTSPSSRPATAELNLSGQTATPRC